ncbi:MAG: 5-bromo-4-chloroindolyl phosphate hydrolysis family protein [Oscillospiraceae bacterium]
MRQDNNRDNKKPVSPLYIVAALWLGWSLIFPLLTLMNYLPLIISAVVLYQIVSKIIKNKSEETGAKEQTYQQTPAKPVSEEKKTTGNPDVDKLIIERDRAISEMRRLNYNIKDEKITQQINDMEATTSKIFDHVIANPDKLGQIGKFLNYYLPTTMKLLNTYDRMGSQGVRGENIASTMTKVENTLDMIVQAFHKQLDTLFAGEALDVSTDITVMENLMKNEGLAGEDMPGLH